MDWEGEEMKGWRYKQSLKWYLDSLSDAIGDAIDEVEQSEQSAYDLDVDDLVQRLREVEDAAESLIGKVLISEDRAKREPQVN
jgi:hypothetical protein